MPNNSSRLAHTPDVLTLLLLASILLISGLPNARPAAGWLWDFANGLGFAAIAGMVYISLQRPALVPAKVHQAFSYVVLALVLIHAAWFLFADPIVLEYLKPGAPVYMWAGMLSAFLLAFTIVFARQPLRRQSHSDHDGFRYWHRLLGALALLAAAYHIIASGLYLQSTMAIVAFSLLLLPAFAGRTVNRIVAATPYALSTFLLLAMLAAILFAAARNVVL